MDCPAFNFGYESRTPPNTSTRNATSAATSPVAGNESMVKINE